MNWTRRARAISATVKTKAVKAPDFIPLIWSFPKQKKVNFHVLLIERYHKENVVVFTGTSSAIRGRTASRFLSGPQRPYLSEDTASPARTRESGLSHLRGRSWGITFHAGQPQESAHQSGLLGDGQGFHALTRTIHRWFLSGTALPGMQERPWLGLLH